MVQGLRNKKTTLNPVVSMRLGVKLSEVVGKECSEDPFCKLSNNRGIYFLYGTAAMKLIIKIRCESHKAPMSLSTSEEKILKAS